MAQVSKFSFTQLERLERMSNKSESGELDNETLLTHAKVGQSVASLTHAHVRAARFENGVALAVAA